MIVMSESQHVFDRLTALLRERKVAFKLLCHEPVFTSEQAAEVRGTSLSSGAKALICKLDQQFVMFVMPADRRLASKVVRKQLSVRSLRFASIDEVKELTSLEPGSIPPFGSLFGLVTYCDQALAEETQINFNAGDHAKSVSMSYSDYAQVEQPRIGVYSIP